MKKKINKDIIFMILLIVFTFVFVGLFSIMTSERIINNANHRKVNGVFFETNDGQIIITEDSQIWNVSKLNYRNGERIRATFNDQYTTIFKEDDTITDIKTDLFCWGEMYIVSRRANDGKPFYIDLYQVKEVIFPTDDETGDLVSEKIKYIFHDGTEFIGYIYSVYNKD